LGGVPEARRKGRSTDVSKCPWGAAGKTCARNKGKAAVKKERRKGNRGACTLQKNPISGKTSERQGNRNHGTWDGKKKSTYFRINIPRKNSGPWRANRKTKDPRGVRKSGEKGGKKGGEKKKCDPYSKRRKAKIGKMKLNDFPHPGPTKKSQKTETQKGTE